ncbi:MAG: GntR family transcriptional regulator [Lachnospiraceae bacterium]|nr:GntR family transcriptional regulator [Lachnospiraceae bacterium]
MAWVLYNDRPIYAQIVERIQMQIISGMYKPGDKLPSVRELAMEAGVNPNTMQKAFGELERKELIVTIRTSGRMVTEDVAMIEKVKNQFAKEQIKEFLQKMRELGFETEETIRLLKSINEEEES